MYLPHFTVRVHLTLEISAVVSQCRGSLPGLKYTHHAKDDSVDG